MIKLFGISIRPEIDQPIYWLHLLGIALIVEFLLNQFVTPMQITLQTTLISTLIIGISDIIMHTILKLY